MQQAPSFQVIDGQLIGARQIASPNYNQRPEQTEIQLLVVHNISLPPSQFGGGYIEQFFQNQLDWSVHPYFQTIEGMQVSTHLLILRTGEVLQFVNFNHRAWHAGQWARWRARAGDAHHCRCRGAARAAGAVPFGGGDDGRNGGVVAWPRAGSRQRRQVRRRALHQPFA